MQRRRSVCRLPLSSILSWHGQKRERLQVSAADKPQTLHQIFKALCARARRPDNTRLALERTNPHLSGSAVHLVQVDILQLRQLQWPVFCARVAEGVLGPIVLGGVCRQFSSFGFAKGQAPRFQKKGRAHLCHLCGTKGVAMAIQGLLACGAAVVLRERGCFRSVWTMWLLQPRPLSPVLHSIFC